MYERSHVKVQVEPRSNFTVMQDTSYIASISFTREKRMRLHTSENYATVEIHLNSSLLGTKKKALPHGYEHDFLCRLSGGSNSCHVQICNNLPV